MLQVCKLDGAGLFRKPTFFTGWVPCQLAWLEPAIQWREDRERTVLFLSTRFRPLSPPEAVEVDGKDDEGVESPWQLSHHWLRPGKLAEGRKRLSGNALHHNVALSSQCHKYFNLWPAVATKKRHTKTRSTS